VAKVMCKEYNAPPSGYVPPSIAEQLEHSPAPASPITPPTAKDSVAGVIT
jgi:hypothetical protein